MCTIMYISQSVSVQFAEVARLVLCCLFDFFGATVDVFSMGVAMKKSEYFISNCCITVSELPWPVLREKKLSEVTESRAIELNEWLCISKFVSSL